jgi:hypothetical protein
VRPAGLSDRSLAAAHKATSNVIRFERFQIGLPPGKFGIILRADRHYPVVPANTQSEMPP